MSRTQTGAVSTSTKAGGAKPTKDQVPRPSASLVIINDKDEVLMVQRTLQASAYAGVTVFPGGNYDPKQDSSIKMTAIRETFEESGLLIARPISSSSSQKMPSDAELDRARHEIHSNRMLFKDFLDQHGLELDVDSLIPFTEWVTPPDYPRRFHTRFFVTFLPAASSTGFKSGDKRERIPKPDGSQEVVTTRFLHPSVAFSENRASKITFMPPQIYILATIQDVFSTFPDRTTQHAKIRELSGGLFGKMVINPRKMDANANGRGDAVLTYEGDETRGGKKGRLHRSEVKVGKGGVSTVALRRNFDIFTEIESDWFNNSLEEQEGNKAKL
ncbi:hypothetical protein K435DRAFT_651163 [Dendrothele bispora CBS 962.96]|uniref:Nudix hydrolase domain-containing protein n=1 Tax=Dendrothele bispora (strain CBS 962.96) TaxID=1314807 RepID=A0A4S8MMN5_DENBC|nr:hypothetical protein K435DRAFT_651163 [Dendrothele bispora CBS 962.96]